VISVISARCQTENTVVRGVHSHDAVLRATVEVAAAVARHVALEKGHEAAKVVEGLVERAGARPQVRPEVAPTAVHLEPVDAALQRPLLAVLALVVLDVVPRERGDHRVEHAEVRRSSTALSEQIRTNPALGSFCTETRMLPNSNFLNMFTVVGSCIFCRSFGLKA